MENSYSVRKGICKCANANYGYIHKVTDVLQTERTEKYGN